MTENQNTERGFGRKMTLSDKIYCTLGSVGIVLFCFWMSSGWPLVLLPFCIDIYWTRFIPWSWWKNINNGVVRWIMSWVDAIVFAILAVWVLQNFFFQNFQIPTTSLEKTMMAGDYLLVSKFHYGPRVPIGGGAFSGKDGTKVDRSAAYYARKIAVDYLQQYDAHEVYVYISYALGKAEPVDATAFIDGEIHAVTEYDLSPCDIIGELELQKPSFEERAKWGHFSR